MGKKVLHILIPVDLHDKLRDKAHDGRVSMAHIVTCAVEAYLAGKKRGKANQ